MTITVLAYKANSSFYVMGCHQASYSSDLRIGETGRAAEFAAKYLSFKGDMDEDGYSIIVLADGRGCSLSGFIDASDFFKDDFVGAVIKTVWRKAQRLSLRKATEEEKRKAAEEAENLRLAGEKAALAEAREKRERSEYERLKAKFEGQGA
jgi:hypothetical protein